MKAQFEITPDTYDPTIEWGDKVLYFPNYFPDHANITWNDIVPLWQAERNNDYLRMLTPPNELVTENHIDYDGETENPDLAFQIDRQVIVPTFVTHTQDNLNDHVRTICEEAYALKLRNLHTYSTVMAESYVFKSHKDPHSIMLVQCIGMTSYHFEDGTIHQLKEGDGLYIPRGIYHAPQVFGPRVTFSYNWHYLR